MTKADELRKQAEELLQKAQLAEMDSDQVTRYLVDAIVTEADRNFEVARKCVASSVQKVERDASLVFESTGPKLIKQSELDPDAPNFTIAAVERDLKERRHISMDSFIQAAIRRLDIGSEGGFWVLLHEQLDYPTTRAIRRDGAEPNAQVKEYMTKLRKRVEEALAAKDGIVVEDSPSFDSPLGFSISVRASAKAKDFNVTYVVGDRKGTLNMNFEGFSKKGAPKWSSYNLGDSRARTEDTFVRAAVAYASQEVRNFNAQKRKEQLVDTVSDWVQDLKSEGIFDEDAAVRTEYLRHSSRNVVRGSVDTATVQISTVRIPWLLDEEQAAASRQKVPVTVALDVSSQDELNELLQAVRKVQAGFAD